MSQWGPPRTFTAGLAEIVATPIVRTEPWEPARDHDTIDDVLITEKQGPFQELALLEVEARSFIGKTMHDWVS